MNDAWLQQRRGNPNLTLLELLISRRGLGVTNPADYVYAHLGLVADDWASYVTVDYSKSTVGLFEELAVHWYDTGETQILSQLNHTPKGRAQGPSWVPDWSIPACVAPKGFDHNSNINSRKPLRRTNGKYRVFLPERHTLAWLARQHAKITRISNPLNGAHIDRSKREAFTRLLATLQASCQKFGFGDSDYKRLGAKDSIKAFRSIYRDIYAAWEEAINDHLILPPLSKTEHWDFEDDRLWEIIKLFFCPDFYSTRQLNFSHWADYRITDTLIQYFIPGFDERILHNKVLISTSSPPEFYSTRLWLGPKITQVNDMIYDFYSAEPFYGTYYMSFLVRPCQNADALISKVEEAEIRKRLSPLPKSKPVMVCSMIGVCYGSAVSTNHIGLAREHQPHYTSRDDCILAIV